MKTYETLEHTADLKIKVWGKNLPDLFINAAKAMSEQIATIDEDKPKTDWEAVDIKADELKFLLVDWLSEILSLIDINGIIYTDFEFDELTDNEVRAKIRGLPIKEKKLDIKAVTYHQTEVEKKDEHWEAIIIFDI